LNFLPTRTQRLLRAGRLIEHSKILGASLPPSSHKSADKPSLSDWSDSQLLTQAFLAANTNQPQLAVELFREASARDPRDPFVLLELAKCYRRLHQLDRMKGALTRVKKFAKKDPIVSLTYAKACEAMRDMDEAMTVYQELAKVRGARVAAQAGQVALLERLNRLEQAEDVIHRMGETGRKNPVVRLTQAKIAHRRGDWDKAESEFRALTKTKDAAIGQEAGYLLASTLDKQQEYDAAIETLDRTKRPLRDSQQAIIALRGFRAARDMTAQALEECSERDLANWRESADSADSAERPLAFLVGHPRSGTTLLEQTLDAHDEIRTADETGAFHDAIWMPLSLEASRQHDGSLAKVFDATHETRWSALQTNYFDNLRMELRESTRVASADSQSPATTWIDKNPALTLQLLMIMRALPAAKLIVALRDPRDVIISAYMQSVQLSNWSVNWLTLEDTVEMYVLAMHNWLKMRELTRSDWIEIRYEDCVADLAQQGRRAINFLGLDWQTAQETPHEHVKHKAVFSPTYGDVSKPVYASSVARWRRYEKHLAPFQEKLAPFVEAFGYGA